MNAPVSALNSIDATSDSQASEKREQRLRDLADREQVARERKRQVKAEIAFETDKAAQDADRAAVIKGQVRNFAGGNLDVLAKNFATFPEQIWNQAVVQYLTAEAVRENLPEILALIDEEICGESRRNLAEAKARNKKLLGGVKLSEIRRVPEQPTKSQKLPVDICTAAPEITRRGCHFVKTPRRKKCA